MMNPVNAVTDGASSDVRVGRCLHRARRTDPASSHRAAELSGNFAPTHVGRILAALEAISTGTAAEIAQQSGLTVVQVDRRRKEMEQAGLVYMLRQDGQLFLRDGFMVWARVAGA
jgi:acyl dehydratase